MRGLRWLALATLVACLSSPPKTGSDPVSKPPPFDPPAPSLRLPGDVRPTAYRLELTIDPAAKHAEGRVIVEAQVVRATRVIWLHAAPEITIKSAGVAGARTELVRKGDFVGLVATRDKGAVSIELTFTSPIDHTRSRGIYAENDGGDAYAYTFFEPLDARRAFPCFDEPAYKTPWTLVLDVAQAHVALANAAIEKEILVGARKRVEFAATKPLPTYLVAFVVGPFEIVDGGTGGRAKTPIRFILPKGRSAELGWAKRVTPRVVAALEDYFDMTYPFGKLDVAVVPRYWGTMEHPGLVAMGQPLTLIKPNQETRSRKQDYLVILAHELAHYWFGDYVTMAWWDDTWLNESLAQWLDMVITDQVEPSWRYKDDRVRFATSAMTADEALSTQAIRQPATTREAIAASFDAEIVYQKGSSVMRMFEAWAGAEPWRDAMRAFMAKYAWGTATAHDYFDHVRDKLGEPVELGLRSFIEQPGVPVILFQLQCDTGKVTLRQTRALANGQLDPGSPLWRVPVCFRYGDPLTSHQSCTLLDAVETTLPLATCPTWFVPNQEARGYYRSSIDTKLAAVLLDHRNPLSRHAKPTPAERMMIVADLRAMVERGELTIDEVLALAPTVVADPDPRVASWAVTAASFRADALDDNLHQLARGWYERSFGNIARRLRWFRSFNDTEERHQMRRHFVPMIAMHDSRLGPEAERLVDRWLRDGKGIEDDLVDSALDVAAFRGNKARFDRYLESLTAAKDRGEKTRLLHALAGFTDPVLVERALAIVLGTEHDLRDTSGIVLRMLGRRETRDAALDFLDKHINALMPRMRSDEASWFLGAIAGAFCDPDRRKRAADLVTSRAARIDGARAIVTRGLEKSNQCIAELARQLPDLQAFLKK